MDNQIKVAAKLLHERLKEVMVREGLQYEVELARYLEVPRDTVRRYLKLRDSRKRTSLPTPETLAKIRKKAPEITDEDANTIGVAYSRLSSQSRSLGNKTRFGGTVQEPKVKEVSVNENHQPGPDRQASDQDARIGRAVRRIVAQIMAGKSPAMRSSSSVELLSQSGDRYQVGDMPAILTKENFEAVDVSSWTELDKKHFLGYLNQVLEQARKAMSLLARFTSDALRDDLLEKAGRNADLLWRTYKIAASVAPIEYVNDIDLEGKCHRFNQTSSSTKGEQQ